MINWESFTFFSDFQHFLKNLLHKFERDVTEEQLITYADTMVSRPINNVSLDYKMSHIRPKWEKSGFFSDQDFQYILARRCPI